MGSPFLYYTSFVLAGLFGLVSKYIALNFSLSLRSIIFIETSSIIPFERKEGFKLFTIEEGVQRLAWYCIC